MQKKGIFVGVTVLALGVGIFFYLRSSETMTETASDKEEKGDERSTLTTDNVSKSIEEQIKDVKINLSKPVSDNFQEYSNELEATIENNKKELEECEANFDRLFGNNLEEENTQIYTEDQIGDVLEEFDNLALNPKSSARLLELLANDQVAKLKPDEVGQKLKELRPCRPYKKMSFIHGLMTQSKKNKWSDATKQRALKSVFKYFDKELSDHTTISNLNIQASLLHTLVSEGMLPKKYEEKILDFKDELEDSYDDLLDQADEIREANEQKGEGSEGLPLNVIKNEFKLSTKFRDGMKSLLNDIRPQAE